MGRVSSLYNTLCHALVGVSIPCRCFFRLPRLSVSLGSIAVSQGNEAGFYTIAHGLSNPQMRRLPAIASASVMRSAYSRSPPRGSPRASRVTATPMGCSNRAK